MLAILFLLLPGVVLCFIARGLRQVSLTVQLPAVSYHAVPGLNLLIAMFAMDLVAFGWLVSNEWSGHASATNQGDCHAFRRNLSCALVVTLMTIACAEAEARLACYLFPTPYTLDADLSVDLTAGLRWLRVGHAALTRELARRAQQ